MSRGLSSLVAALLDPDPAARPGDEIGPRLRAFAAATVHRAGAAPGRSSSRSLRRPDVPGEPSPEPPRRLQRPTLGLVVGLVALLAAGGAVHRGVRSTPPPSLERLSFDELGKRSRGDSVLADLSLPLSCPDFLRGRLYLARHHLGGGRGGAALDLLLPLVREGLPERAGAGGALLLLAEDAAHRGGQEGPERFGDELLAGIERAPAGSPAKATLQACFDAQAADVRLRSLARRLVLDEGSDGTAAGLIRQMLASLGERSPVVRLGEGLSGPVRRTVGAWWAGPGTRTWGTTWASRGTWVPSEEPDGSWLRPGSRWGVPIERGSFAVPSLAGELCRQAGLLAGEPALGAAVRERLVALRSDEGRPERRALLALALVASHRPNMEPGSVVPSDAALQSAGRSVAADPALADLPRLLELPPLVLGTLAWAVGPVLAPGGPNDHVHRAVLQVVPLVPSLAAFSPEERWLLLLHGRGERRYAASSSFAALVRGATTGTTPDERFLATNSLLLDAPRLGAWIDEVEGLDGLVGEERQAVVDSGLVAWSHLGSKVGLVALEPRRTQRVVLVGKVLAMVARRWPAPSPLRRLMVARILRTVDDVVQEEEEAFRDGALETAARVAGRRVEDLITDLYERILTPGGGIDETPEVTLWGALWLTTRGEGGRAESLLLRLDPEGLPAYLRWRWRLYMAAAVAQLPGKVDEARALLEAARRMPWAVEDMIRNESVRILTVRPYQGVSEARGR